MIHWIEGFREREPWLHFIPSLSRDSVLAELVCYKIHKVTKLVVQGEDSNSHYSYRYCIPYGRYGWVDRDEEMKFHTRTMTKRHTMKKSLDVQLQCPSRHFRMRV